MAQISRPWNGQAYSDSDWRQLLSKVYGPLPLKIGGIFDYNNESGIRGLEIKPTTVPSLAVDVHPGAAMIDGLLYTSDDVETFKIPRNNSTNKRIDVIVIQVDYVGQKAELVIKIGEQAIDPVAPSIINTSSIKEVPIGYITTDVLDTTIQPVNIKHLNSYLNSQTRMAYTLKNSTTTTIKSGTVVEIDSSENNSIKPATTFHSFGVALEDIHVNSWGAIGTRGPFYIRAHENIVAGETVLGDPTDYTSVFGSPDNLSLKLGHALESTQSEGLGLCYINKRGAALTPIIKDVRTFDEDNNTVRIQGEIENFGFPITSVIMEWTYRGSVWSKSLPITSRTFNYTDSAFSWPSRPVQNVPPSRPETRFRYQPISLAGAGTRSAWRRSVARPYYGFQSLAINNGDRRTFSIYWRCGLRVSLSVNTMDAGSGTLYQNYTPMTLGASNTYTHNTPLIVIFDGYPTDFEVTAVNEYGSRTVNVDYDG